MMEVKWKTKWGEMSRGWEKKNKTKTKTKREEEEKTGWRGNGDKVKKKVAILRKKLKDNLGFN